MLLKAGKKDNKDLASEDSFEFNGGDPVKGPQTSLPLKMPQHSVMTHNKERRPTLPGQLRFNSFKSASLVEVGRKIIESARLKTLRKQPL